MGAWDPFTKKPTIAMDAFLGIKKSDTAGIHSVEKNNHDEAVTLFPNPLSNKALTVKLKNPAGTTRVRIYSITGQKLREKYTNQNNVVFNDLELPSGIYFIQIINQNNIEVRKLIVK